MSVRDKINPDFLYYYDQGKCLNAYEVFGSHLVKNEKGENIGCEFALYAPNAKRVQLVGEWNHFIENQQELYCIDENKSSANHRSIFVLLYSNLNPPNLLKL